MYILISSDIYIYIIYKILTKLNKNFTVRKSTWYIKEEEYSLDFLFDIRNVYSN